MAKVELSLDLCGTNIRVPKGSRRKTTGFHWLEDWDAHEDEDGKPTEMSLTLPRWLFDGIVEKGMVRTTYEDYFNITEGIERGLYRIAEQVMIDSLDSTPFRTAPTGHGYSDATRLIQRDLTSPNDLPCGCSAS